MVKAPKPKKERAKQYNDKLAVKGIFMDIIQASVKDAKANTAKKVADKKKGE